MSASAWMALVIGVVCIVIAIVKGLLGLIDASTREKKCTEKIVATISELKIVIIRKKPYDQPTYEYEVNGVKYHKKLPAEPQKTHKIGQQEHILVDPAKPTRMIPARGVGSNSLAMLVIFGLIGIVATVYGVVQMIKG